MEKKMETTELCRDYIDEVILGTMEKRMETTKMVSGHIERTRCGVHFLGFPYLDTICPAMIL